MRTTTPKVFLIGETSIHRRGMRDYLNHIGANAWTTDASSDVEELSEVYSRSCYKSFGTELNANLTRTRMG